MSKSKPPRSPQSQSVAIRDRIIELRRVPAHQLQANPKNWRKHPAEQVAALRGVLGEIGFAGAELCRELPDGSLQLIDGHARADIMGDQLVPCLVTDLSEGEADLLLATFDPLGAMATSDTEKLDTLLREVETSSEDVAKMLQDLAKQAGCDWAKENGEVIEDEVPEPPTEPVTKPGDLWLLGEHRLLCGDSTNAEDVGRLMGGEKADLCFTSPPYNAATFGWEQKGKYQDDADDKTQDGYRDFLNCFTEATMSCCAAAIVNIQQLSGNKIAFIEWLYQWRKHLVDVAIWDKGHAAPAMEPAVMSSAFEYLVILSQDEQPTRKIPYATWRGTQQNIHRGNKQTANEVSAQHRATFPVHLPGWGLGVCENAKTIYEPFSGSGTTIIAAEQLNRRCYAMEISPQYVDVAVQRWEKLTGKKAIREAYDRDGEEPTQTSGVVNP